MSTMNEETMALSVADATMQDWLAAVTMFQFAPPSTYSTARFDPHPERPGPAPVRRATPCRPRSVVQPARASAPSGVAGAHTAYWLGLALALSVFVFL